MRDDRPENDPGQIWRNQPAEPFGMTLEKIRRKVREQHAKERRQLLGCLGRAARRSLLLRIPHQRVRIARTAARSAIRIRACLEPRRAVFPDPRKVVRGHAGRCGFQRRSRFWPVVDRAAAAPTFPLRPAVVIRASASGPWHDDWRWREPAAGGSFPKPRRPS